VKYGKRQYSAGIIFQILGHIFPDKIFIQTFTKFPVIFLTAVEFPDISRFARRGHRGMWLVARLCAGVDMTFLHTMYITSSFNALS